MKLASKTRFFPNKVMFFLPKKLIYISNVSLLLAISLKLKINRFFLTLGQTCCSNVIKN